MGLRERKRQRTRETIAKVAYALFHEQGYDHTTVEEIAERADVSPRTFYRYFESKDGVLAEGGYSVVDRALERTEDRSVEALVIAMALVYEELVAENHFKDYARILRQNPSITDRTPLWRERWSRYLASQLAAGAGGAGSPTLDQRIASSTTIYIVATAVDEWLYRGRDVAIPELAAETLARLRTSLDPTGGTDAPH